ncbi:hypothetical protein ACFOSV_01515 [Algoriphagus namhaensis]|uniref:Uncharacterized protein n=1 Tax=Algoriphagus namhaensis TaxID=915353 RepID=A0ABV8ALD8_9BACT
MDHAALVKLYRDKGKLTLADGNKRQIALLDPTKWSISDGANWIYLLFDMFQIRAIAPQFSEVSLDLVEFANKPTIYRTLPNFQSKNGPLIDGKIKFSMLKEPNWHKLLFQISQPVLVQLDTKSKVDFNVDILFPLFSPNLKELYLGPEGDVKIIKN